ncbi:uncharacterized protein N7496_009487 [Penicillium cataractarum]|uniref:Uncharacterized protein n=1 Tax=Penicillium cataractarum TaxID=2100454 RepID=A0A9W9V109_9EURO|nr:uncharacterized protein N7496_009487 [Penicillium cataractarum]KAJ5363774.1 hypothetical protein N7496_009487 [Penicillium cataractarum]
MLWEWFTKIIPWAGLGLFDRLSSAILQGHATNHSFLSITNVDEEDRAMMLGPCTMQLPLNPLNPLPEWRLHRTL